MNTLEQQSALVRKFFERRNLNLFDGIRRQRSEIAARMAADGLLQSGAFVVAVTNAYVSGFEDFARGLTKDTFALLERSGLEVDKELASWITGQIEPLIEAAAKNVCGEVKEGAPLGKELKENVDRAMHKSVSAIKRDLGIELDLALLKKTPTSKLIDEALLDTLVPLQNRRGLEQEFGERTKESRDSLCFILFDIDHFKDVNDNYGGHTTGDEALISIAEVARACVRGKGSAFRFGGDEFVLLLPNHTLQEGLAVAERFRREVKESPRTSRKLTLSVSVGVAVYPANGTEFGALQKAADEALYDAKKRGRNLVRYYGEPEPPVVT